MTTSSPTAAPTWLSGPPSEPMHLVRAWLDSANEAAVRDPGHLALATADSRGRASNRIVSVIAVRDTGLVFATHANSPKGRDLAETQWSSGVLYWREVARQVIVSGPTEPLPDDESEALWAAWPIALHPMSVASCQSAVLTDENTLRMRARELARAGSALPRPTGWLGYLLQPASVEFWESGDPDRLYRRLRYQRSGDGWSVDRLQP